MLLDHRTRELFKYGINELSLSSKKPIIIQCDFCSIEFQRYKLQMRKPSRARLPHACQKCDQIKSNWIKNNHDKLPPIEFRNNYFKKGHRSILQNLTKEKFGYSVYDIGPKSEKPIMAVCDFCLSDYETLLCNLFRDKSLDFVSCKPCSAVHSTYIRSNFSKLMAPYEFWKLKRPEVDYSKVDIEKTIEKYGYDPRSLGTYSEKKIFVKCFACDFIVETTKDRHVKTNFQVSCKKCVHIKIKRTLMEKYGVESTLGILSVQEKLSNPKTELIIESILKNKYGVEFVRNYVIGSYTFDFFIPLINLLIECQGDYFHDFKKNGYSGTPRDKAKSTYVEKYTNHKLIWVWEHEIHIGRTMKIFDYHISNINESKITVNLDKIIFKPISDQEAHVFLSQYHYLGNLGTAATPIGAFYESMLICVVVFGGLTRTSSVSRIRKKINNDSVTIRVTRELRRFCVRPNVEVKNLISFCMPEFIKIYQKLHPEIKFLTSFVDHDNLHSHANWKNLGMTSRSYHYADPKTFKFINKKTVFELAKSSHMTERKFAEKLGILKVKEVPKRFWLAVI